MTQLRIYPLTALILTLLLFGKTTVLMSQEVSDDLRKTQVILAKVQDEDRLVGEALEVIQSQKRRLEEDLADAEENPKLLTKAEKKDLLDKVKILKKEESNLLKKRVGTLDFLQKTMSALQATPKKRLAFLTDYEKKFGTLESDKVVDNQIVTTQSAQCDVPIGLPNLATETQAVTAQTELKTEPVAVIESVEETPKKTTKPNREKKKKDAPKTAAVEKTYDNVDEEKSTELLKGNLSGKKQKPVKVTKKSKKSEAKPTEYEPIASTESAPIVPVVVPSSDTLTVSENTTAATPIATENLISSNETDIKSEKKKSSKSSKSERMTPSVSSTVYRNYEAKTDAYLNPPPPDCVITFDGVDNFTGKKKRETAPIVLFNHTEDIMRAAMKGKDFVTCEMMATRVAGAGSILINLTITIQSKDAQKTFGFLDRGAPIVFRFINGKKLTFATNKTDIGIVDLDKNTTTYRAQITATALDEMSDSELDAVRIAWSAGYEDYEVFDLEVLRNLIKCLEKK